MQPLPVKQESFRKYLYIGPHGGISHGLRGRPLLYEGFFVVRGNRARFNEIGCADNKKGINRGINQAREKRQNRVRNNLL